MAELGHDVVGVDVDAHKVELLSNRRAPFFEPELEDLLARNVEAGRLTFTQDFSAIKGAQVHFIGVAYALVLVVRARDLRRRIDLPMDCSRLTYQLALLSIMAVCTSFDGGSWLNGAVWACLILLVTSDMSVLGGGAQAAHRRPMPR